LRFPVIRVSSKLVALHGYEAEENFDDGGIVCTRRGFFVSEKSASDRKS
jgi:hypothetical protein